MTRVLVITLGWVCWCSSGHAGLILETGRRVPVINGGRATVVGESSALGARFSVNQATRITAIGGDFSNPSPNATLFAAIIGLDGPDALPSGGFVTDPGDRFRRVTVLHREVFSVPDEFNSEVVLPTSVVIDPGDYALVFGGGLFGAAGSASMPLLSIGNREQVSTFSLLQRFSTPVQFFWSDTTDRAFNGINTARFFVQGVAVPEPATAAMFLALAICSSARRMIREPTPCF